MPAGGEMSADYYNPSLIQAEDEINKRTKSLKDTVGWAYENHRARIYKLIYSEGFEVQTNYKLDEFTADIVVKCTRTDQVVLIEESKGHYLDSCFLDRAVVSFAKVVVACMKRNQRPPICILHSAARFRGFEDKVDKLLELLFPELREQFKQNFYYTTLFARDRIPKKHWFGKGAPTPYTDYACDDCITKDLCIMRMAL